MPEHKSGNSSETRKELKIEEKLLCGLYIGTHKRNALSNGTIPNTLQPHHPQDWGFTTPPKTSIAIISGRGKAIRPSNLAGTFTGFIRTKTLKNLDKRDRGRIQGLSKFYEYPLLSQKRAKLRTSNFVRTFMGTIETKAIKNVRIFREK